MTAKSQQIYIDPSGAKVPAKYVHAYDKKRDKIARQIEKKWQEEHERLAALKAVTISLIEDLQEAAAKSVGIKDLGGKEGNIQFRSFPGDITIRLDNAKRTEFDERLKFAQQLIWDVIHEMTDKIAATDSTAKSEFLILTEIASKAFQPRSSGNLDRQRIHDLKTYNIKHQKWKQAIEIINECERVIGTATYVRVAVKNEDGKLEYITLDIAKV